MKRLLLLFEIVYAQGVPAPSCDFSVAKPMDSAGVYYDASGLVDGAW